MSQDTKSVKRKDAKKEIKVPKGDKDQETKKETPSDTPNDVKTKFGPSVTFPYQRVWSRCALIIGVLIIVWYNSKQGKEIQLAKQKEVLLSRTQTVTCSEEYKLEATKYPQCIPQKCGRAITDKLVSSTEADILLKLAKSGLSLGGSDGGSSILDLHSGALSRGKAFIDVYSLPEAREIFNNADFAIYRVVKTKIQHAIAHNFGIPANKIYLTKPTFFSRINNISAKTIHDEYWHPHVDKETYESMYYTSLLYLNDYGRDFEGGRFVFLDKNNVNATIEPRKGRVSMFTSGKENLHLVETVKSGTRYALTVSFTCDEKAAIPDPTFSNRVKQTE